MIDQATGQLLVDGESLNLSPKCSRQEFLTSSLGSGSRQLINNPPYTVFLSPKILVRKHHFAGTFGFNGERLVEIRLTISLDEATTSWNNWSEEKELRIKQKQEAFLLAELGAGRDGNVFYRFPWGTIESAYSDRDAESSIVIKYSHNGV